MSTADIAKAAYRMCSRCLLDTTVQSIRFDEAGVCNFCRSHARLAALYPKNAATAAALEQLVDRIKRSRRHYDCIVGVSGGTDSSYALYLAHTLGLTPLAVHFDNGWNTNEAVTNIKALTSRLNVDLVTYVVNWEEFKDLQRAFLKASVPCIEVPTDVGILGALLKTASDEGIHCILGGHSFETEGTVPREWSYIDGTYITSVHRRFGSRKLDSFPNVTLPRLCHYTFIKNIRLIPILNYVRYDKAAAKAFLRREYGWKDYAGHHYENIYSQFAFGWYQYHRFNIDKRKVSLSGPVRAGSLAKADALKLIQDPPVVSEELVKYCISKLELASEEFEAIMKSPNKTYRDYWTSESILRYLKWPVKAAVRMGILTPVLYEKYLA